MRLIALLLTIALAGPSVGALVCDWTCAIAHQAAAATETNCHDTPGAAQTAMFAPAHACHDLPVPDASVLTCATPLADALAAVDTATHELRVLQLSSFSTRRPDRSHAPPPAQLVPLRI